MFTNRERGVAVGPVVYTVALMAVLSGAIAAGSGMMSGSLRTDKVQAELNAQVNLIRQKITECWIVTQGRPGADWPATPPSGLVSDLECPGDPAGARNLWTGARPTALPRPPTAFDAWEYANDATSVRFWTDPESAAVASETQVTTALDRLEEKFASSELVVDPTTKRVTVTVQQ